MPPTRIAVGFHQGRDGTCDVVSEQVAAALEKGGHQVSKVRASVDVRALCDERERVAAELVLVDAAGVHS